MTKGRHLAKYLASGEFRSQLEPPVVVTQGEMQLPDSYGEAPDFFFSGFF